MARAGPSTAALRPPTSSSKPYDRSPTSHQLKAKGKGKGKASATGLPSSLTAAERSVGVNLGAPASLGQASRKGKKAWRKNIDVSEVERVMEEAREEERITGGRIQDRRNEALFTVDVTGDAELGAKLRASRPKRPLRSLAVLSERSAVPSLTSRAVLPSSSSSKIRPSEKARLRKLALRDFRPEGEGAPQLEVTATTVLSDAWAPASSATHSLPGGFGDEAVRRRHPNLPPTLRRQVELRLAAIESGRHTDLPGGGTSYNPTEQSHAALIDEAVQEELGKLAEEAKEEEKTRLLGQVIVARKSTVPVGEYANGMMVGPGEEEPATAGAANTTEGVEEVPTKKKVPKRKTQAQRNRTLRARKAAEEAKHLAAQARINKIVGGAAGGLAAFRKAEEERVRAADELTRARKLAKREKERLGLVGGEKVGRGRVGKASVAVQLGEDLAETLRQVKPEGNHFRDRYLSLQKKGLVAPRDEKVRSGPKGRTKEFEKHAYKRFE